MLKDKNRDVREYEGKDKQYKRVEKLEEVIRAKGGKY